jgi:hypothetical protein
VWNLCDLCECNIYQNRSHCTPNFEDTNQEVTVCKQVRSLRNALFP